MKPSIDQKKYLKAQKKVQRLRSFYIHLIAYFIVNTIVTMLKVSRNINNGETLEIAFHDFGTYAIWLVWGIGLAIHAFSVFGMDKILGDDWESKKIEEYMNNEKLKNK